MYLTKDKLKSNNFNFMRLIASIMVIFTHSFVLTGVGVKEDFFYSITNGDLLISLIWLRTFFTISGFLICQSLEHSNSYSSYLTKRLLRIFPAFIVCITLTVFVIGPLFTSLPITEYFNKPETWNYFSNFLLFNY